MKSKTSIPEIYILRKFVYIYTVLSNINYAHLSIILSIDITHKLAHTVTVIIWWSECMLLYTPAWWEYDKVCHGHPRFCGRTREHSEYGGILQDHCQQFLIIIWSPLTHSMIKGNRVDHHKLAKVILVWVIITVPCHNIKR